MELPGAILSMFCGLCAAGTVWASGLPGGEADDSGTSRPNVLLILADDQRWDTIRALGNSEIRTPNLDRLVARVHLQ